MPFISNIIISSLDTIGHSMGHSFYFYTERMMMSSFNYLCNRIYLCAWKWISIIFSEYEFSSSIAKRIINNIVIE